MGDTEKGANISVLDAYWNKFLSDTGRDPFERCAGDLSFDADGFASDSQMLLVLSGKKNAMFSTFQTFSIDGEPLPVAGELYLVLDRAENPRCVIELQDVSVVSYEDVTLDMALREGQDASLEEWRERTRSYIEDEGAVLGFEFSPRTKLVFQTFRLVYR